MVKNYPTIFILTHGRPDSQLTLNLLNKYNYKGDIFLILDDTDATIQRYIDNYGAEKLIVFNKNHYINTVATNSNEPKYACILYAKCAAEDIARYMNLSTFIIMDDDVKGFRLRYGEGDTLRSYKDFDLSSAFYELSNYARTAGISMIGLAGINMARSGVQMLTTNHLLKNRIPYNCVLRNTDYVVNWEADIFEDVITEYLLNLRGNLALCIPYIQYDISSETHITSSGESVFAQAGGMSSTYSGDGFKIVFRCCIDVPGLITIRAKKFQDKVEYQIVKRKDFPRIVSDKYKK